MHTRCKKSRYVGGGADSCLGEELLRQSTKELLEGTICDPWVECRNEWSLEAEACFWRMHLSQQRQHGFSVGKFEGRPSVLPNQGPIMSVLSIQTHRPPTSHALAKVKVFDARVLL